ncbi:MAG: hypothetical protein DRH51_04920 [Candidatus Coatesbacteria bacterium]|nr:MAG: hypothetical protein DRH51_04920 [Candidatus Coatesbacteria bacterium]RLC41215.1 MAG: hypothetical protein DRH44_07665 [Candidatus Coatesbacteria bacterium]
MKTTTKAIILVPLLTGLALSQTTFNIGDMEFNVGGYIQALWVDMEKPIDTGYYRYEYDLERNDTIRLRDARITLSGNYKETVGIYLEPHLGGLDETFNDWGIKYEPWDEDYGEFPESRADLYLGYGWFKWSILTIRGGRMFVPAGIEATMRSPELHFVDYSNASRSLLPGRDEGIDLCLLLGEKEDPPFIELDTAIFHSFSPDYYLNHWEGLEPEDNYYTTGDCKGIWDKPKVISLSFNPIPVKFLSGLSLNSYFLHDRTWSWDIHKEWHWPDGYEIINQGWLPSKRFGYGVGFSLNFPRTYIMAEYIYDHILRDYRWETFERCEENFARLGLVVGGSYCQPLGFLKLEPTFRIDLFDPDKHFDYDRVITYTFGINTYLIDGHLVFMANYEHPQEQVPSEDETYEEARYESQYPDDRFLFQLMVSM